MQLQKYKGKLHKIDQIFISHLHGDHYLGVMGVIYSMHLQKRHKDLNIYSYRGLDEIITLQLKHSQTVLSFRINFIPLKPGEVKLLFENSRLTVSSIPMKHRIPCSGFLFQEKPKPRKLIKKKLPKDISVSEIVQLQKGEDLRDEEGNIRFKNEDLTMPKKARSYAYFSDTLYQEQLADLVQGVDLLYHEATFIHEKVVWANKTLHSTAHQAAQLAKKAEVQQLILGHFSARYKELDPLLEEAQKIFPNTRLAIEGETFEIPEK